MSQETDLSKALAYDIQKQYPEKQIYYASENIEEDSNVYRQIVLGNVIVIVLEGMIVAIQVVRLQYYEFFSKFFTETGREFEPFEFKYK